MHELEILKSLKGIFGWAGLLPPLPPFVLLAAYVSIILIFKVSEQHLQVLREVP